MYPISEVMRDVLSEFPSKMKGIFRTREVQDRYAFSFVLVGIYMLRKETIAFFNGHASLPNIDPVFGGKDNRHACQKRGPSYSPSIPAEII